MATKRDPQTKPAAEETVAADGAPPAVTPDPAEVPATPVQPPTAEEWAAKKGHMPQPYGAVKAFNGWPIGKELTEAEYDKAVTANGKLRFG